MVNVNMEVRASPKTGGGVEFALVPLAGAGPYSHGNGLTFPHGKPAYDIKFLLRDDTNLGLSFPQKATDAIWIDPGLTCPPGPQQAGDGQGAFGLGPVSARQLTITNSNKNAGDYTFKLRFESRSGEIVEYDPVIQNGGGGGNFMAYAMIAIVGTVVVIGGCVALLR
jgi:hypothetical protein